MSSTRRITVRMPVDILGRLNGMPEGRSSSYIVEAVRQRLDRDKQAAIEAGLKCLAYDDEANDISGFRETQADVMGRV